MKRSPQTILHLITTLDVGGAEMMLLKLSSFMDSDHFSNHVVCLTDAGFVGQKIAAQGIPVHAMNMPNGRLTLDGLLKLWGQIRSIRPKILQTWLYHADLLGLIFGRLAGIEHIAWNIRCSNMKMANYRRSSQWTLKLCTKLSHCPDVIVSNSIRGQEFHASLGYRARRWEVIPNGVSLDEFAPDEQGKAKLLDELGLVKGQLKGGHVKGRQTEPENRHVLIGLVARYDAKKDHATFIRAGCLLLQKMGNVHFVLAGRGVTGENHVLAGQVPHVWRNHFHLLGERADVSNILAGLDIACLSSSYGEGFPNVVVEAMACGVPCVVTNVGDSARIVRDTGRVVPPGHPEALADAWNELIDLGEDHRRKLGMAARQVVKDHFGLQRIVRKYEALYTSLVAEGSRPT
jgi:glycosyltransferase involved in cell wall biosynthesis